MTVEHAAVACLRMDLYMTLDQSDRAVAVGLDYLRQLGIDWSPHPTEEEVRREYERIWSQLGSRAIEELIDLPLMTDPASLATLDVLTKLVPPAFFTDANLLALVICRAVNLSLERGNSDASCVAYVVLGMIAGARFGDYQAGFRFGQLGYDLVERRGLDALPGPDLSELRQPRPALDETCPDGRDLLRRAFEAANRDRRPHVRGLQLLHLNTNLLAAGDPLAEAQREAEHGLRSRRRRSSALSIDIIAPQLGLIRTLRGLTPRFGCFDDGQFDELRFERHLCSESGSWRCAECWYWIRKLQARFFAGDYASAIDAASKAQRLPWTSPSLVRDGGVSLLWRAVPRRVLRLAPPTSDSSTVEALAAHHRQLEVWAENCPENFENRAALVGAEIARIEGRELDADAPLRTGHPLGPRKRLRPQ